MSDRLYFTCMALFGLQEFLLLFLIVYLGFLWNRQSQQTDALRKEQEADGDTSKKSDDATQALIRKLPRLAPLKCAECGAGVLLEATDTLCPNCHARGPLPKDYEALAALKSVVAALVRNAVRYWWLARFLTSPLTTWLFVLLAIAVPCLNGPFLSSSDLHQSQIDKLLAPLGKFLGETLLIGACCATIAWAVVFVCLALLGGGLRKDLPASPALATGAAHARETDQCKACGGSIEYDAGDFACICSYCHVENFRVQFARSARLHEESQAAATKSVLFAAKEIIDGYMLVAIGVAVVILGATAFLFISAAVKSWWNDL